MGCERRFDCVKASSATRGLISGCGKFPAGEIEIPARHQRRRKNSLHASVGNIATKDVQHQQVIDRRFACQGSNRRKIPAFSLLAGNFRRRPVRRGLRRQPRIPGIRDRAASPRIAPVISKALWLARRLKDALRPELAVLAAYFWPRSLSLNFQSPEMSAGRAGMSGWEPSETGLNCDETSSITRDRELFSCRTACERETL